MCYMTGEAELSQSLARVAAEADRLRAKAGAMLREAVGQAAEQGLTQRQIADATGRSQPEVSRLLRAYRDRRFRPSSPLGRVLARHRDEIIALARAHHVTDVRVFGSVVRGEEGATSDIDLLVDLAPGADLFDLAALEVELERLLGHPVDIVPARMLKPHVAPSALAEAVQL
jgi:predicted nucleotidyltransferase